MRAGFQTLRITVSLLILTLMAFQVMQLQAQSKAKGGVTGKVSDEYMNEILIGASVYLKGTTQGTVTNMEGKYTLAGISEGDVTIVISYMGYKSFEQNVMVIAGKFVTLDVILEVDAEILDEVVVFSASEAQRSALNQQKTADNIMNIVSSDLIGRFPDLNVAEALQRVSGVNISRSRGEGSTVSLRGTPKHFTSISINGEQIPSSQADGSRNESLDLIPADQLAFMEVTKALTPDMDGDAIGGTINLLTPIAYRLNPKIKVEGGVGYSHLSEAFNGIGRLKYGQRFFGDDKIKNGKLGVLLGYSYYGANNSEDRFDSEWSSFNNIPITSLDKDTTVMENFEYRDLFNKRTRMGATATIDYKFNNTNSIVFKFMYNQKTDKDIRNTSKVFLNDVSGIEFVSLDTFNNAELRRSIDIIDENSQNYTYNLSGNHTIRSAKIDWMGFYSTSEKTSKGLNGRFEADNGVDLVATNPGGMYNDFVAVELIDSDVSFHYPFLFNSVQRYEDTDISINAYNMVAKANVEIPYQIGSLNSILKFGVKYRQQGNRRNTYNLTKQFFDPNNFVNSSEAFASIISDYEDEDFFNNQVRFGPSIDEGKFREFIDDNHRVFIYDTVRTDRDSYNNTYDAQEDIVAGYMMTKININRFMFLGGARFESTDVKYDAYKVFSQSGKYTPLSDSRSYHYFLPNFHIRYKFNELTYIRSAATWSYARPNFVDIVPYLSIQEDGSSMRSGNPDLLASSAANFDLLFERYIDNISNVGIISAGVFYKNIDKFQFRRHLLHLEPGDPYYEEFPGFSFQQEQNGENAVVYGAELNLQSQLNFLPGILQGLGLFLNYTFTESDAFTYDRSNINLPGQAKHTANASLTFDYKGFSSKASANYNGEFLTSVAGEAANDIIQVARLQIDLNASYKIDKNWQIFAEFMNITNAPSIRYQGIRPRIYSFKYYGWWNRFGVSYRF